MSISDDLNEHITSERTFLHDISNQLVIAQGMGSFIVNHIKKNSDDPEAKECKRADKTMKAINKIIELVKSRREVVRSTQSN